MPQNQKNRKSSRRQAIRQKKKVGDEQKFHDMMGKSL